MTTVASLRDDAFPEGTEQRGGAAGNGRVVTGTARYRARTPAFPSLRGGELALVPLNLVPGQADPSTLERLVAQLAVAGIAGVVLFNAPIVARGIRGATQAAEIHALPLFVAPNNCTPDGFDLAVLTALARGRETLLMRSQALQARFASLAMGGGGRQALVDDLVRILGVPVAWEDTDARCVAWGVPAATLPDPMASISTNLPDILRPARTDLQRWARTVRVAADRPPPVDALPIHRAIDQIDGIAAASADAIATRVVVPVAVGPRHVGYLSAIVPAPIGHATSVNAPSEGRVPIDPDTAVALVAAAMAAAVEEARTSAVTDVHDDAVRHVVRDWIMSDDPEADNIVRRAAALGMELVAPFRLLVVSPSAVGRVSDTPHAIPHGPAMSPPGSRPESFARDIVATIDAGRGRRTGDAAHAHWVSLSQGRFAVVIMGETPDRQNEASGAARRVIADRTDLFVGVSRSVASVAGMPDAAVEAARALTVAIHVPTVPRVAVFEDLGVWRLLTTADQLELASYCADLIGPLQTADSKSSGDLLQTLQAFLASGGGLQDTATAIHAHRNTVLYRIDRIERILGRSVRDPESQLALGLALRAMALVPEDGRPYASSVRTRATSFRGATPRGISG